MYVRIDEREKVDVGLNLKNAKAGLCVPDYCRPTALDDGWEYSDATAQLLALYQLRAPWLFQAMASDADGVGIDGLSLPRAFPGLSLGEAARQVYDLRAWLKKQAVSRRPVRSGPCAPKCTHVHPYLPPHVASAFHSSMDLQFFSQIRLTVQQIPNCRFYLSLALSHPSLSATFSSSRRAP